MLTSAAPTAAPAIFLTGVFISCHLRNRSITQVLTRGGLPAPPGRAAGDGPGVRQKSYLPDLYVRATRPPPAKTPPHQDQECPGTAALDGLSGRAQYGKRVLTRQRRP